MSDPTYRIDVRHDPADTPPWMARVVRLSDDQHVASRAAYSGEDAVMRAQQVIAELRLAQEPFSVYVDDDGRSTLGKGVVGSMDWRYWITYGGKVEAETEEEARSAAFAAHIDAISDSIVHVPSIEVEPYKGKLQAVEEVGEGE